jgi:hypothetical protein
MSNTLTFRRRLLRLLSTQQLGDLRTDEMPPFSSSTTNLIDYIAHNWNADIEAAIRARLESLLLMAQAEHTAENKHRK